MPNVRNSPSLSKPPVEAAATTGSGTNPGAAGASRIGTYGGTAPLSSLMSDARDVAASGSSLNEPTQARVKLEETQSNRQGQRATAEEFERSDDEEEDDDDDSEVHDDSRSQDDHQPEKASSLKQPAEPTDKRRRRVTLLIEHPAGDDKGDVTYPRLRVSHGHELSSTSRRVSAARAQYAVGQTELTFRLDEDGNPSATILIYSATDDDDAIYEGRNLIDRVENAAQLVDSVAKHPEAWFAVISKYLDVLDTLENDSAKATEALEEFSEQISVLRELRDVCDNTHGSLQQEVTNNEETIAQARDTVSRLRSERSEARRDGKAKTAKIRELEQTIASLQVALNEAQMPKKPKKNVRTDFDQSEESSTEGSDDERATNIKRESHRATRRDRHDGTPVTHVLSTTVDSNAHNPRYPDISDYHGKPSEDLEQWTAAADTKFARSWANFPTEWSKIEYLRDHCKNTAYSVVKLRALRRSEEPYETAEQLINDLEMNFGLSNEDRKASALQKLTGGSCKQRQNEGASEWLARYNLTATEAQLDQATRRFYALQNLNNDYKASATQNARTGESWTEFCARLRQLEKDIAAAYGQGQKEKRRDGRDTKSDRSGKSSRDNNYHRPKEQFNVIMKKKLCARCLKPGHLPSDQNAPCDGKKMTAWDKSLELNVADTDGPQTSDETLKE